MKTIPAFETLKSFTIKLAKKFTHRTISVDDLVQESYLIYLSCVRNFDPAKGIKFSSYFFQACKSGFIRIASKEREENTCSISSLSREEKNFEPAYEEKEAFDVSDFSALLKGLNEEEKNLLFAFFAEGKKQKELAEINNISAQAINQKIKKAISKIALKF